MLVNSVVVVLVDSVRHDVKLPYETKQHRIKKIC